MLYLHGIGMQCGDKKRCIKLTYKINTFLYYMIDMSLITFVSQSPTCLIVM